MVWYIWRPGMFAVDMSWGVANQRPELKRWVDWSPKDKLAAHVLQQLESGQPVTPQKAEPPQPPKPQPPQPSK